MSAFDPSYGYSLEQLLRVETPPEPADFAEFWRGRYARAMRLQPRPRLSHSGGFYPDFEGYDLVYDSTDGLELGGWVLMPKHAPPTRGFVVGHGYGGRDGPDFHWPLSGAAWLFPAARGLSRSRCPAIPDNPSRHVVHGLERRNDYVLGGCVEDLWLAVSALLALFPWVAGRVGYLGASFGGGVGALALPWEPRIQRAHLNVPSFGHQPLRLQLPSWGSAAAVQAFHRRHPELEVPTTLGYYDAACAARHLRVPVHVAAALADPVVAPPGQFSIYNALAGPKRLFVLHQGHADYPARAEQERALLRELGEFFNAL